jgi:predicted nucleic acid-binding protein
MIYLLDTNVCVSYLREKNRNQITVRLDATNAGDVTLCSLMIAAIALASELILVTHNTAEFNRVPGLRVEDWQLQ